MTRVTTDRPTVDGPPEHPGTILRPGRVIETDGDRALIDLGSARVWADPAMPVRYTPAAGDELLVAGEGDRFWIIGVLRGVGSVTIESVGDVSVRSLAGTLTLGGTEAVEVRAGRMRVFADSLETIARAARDAFGSLLQTVSGRRTVQAGSDYRIIDGTAFQKSERTHAVSKKETRIDGSTVHLG